jgi:hypothetical protein
MNGAIPPLPNTPSWNCAHLKHRDNFTFTFYVQEAYMNMKTEVFRITRDTYGKCLSALVVSEQPLKRRS